MIPKQRYINLCKSDNCSLQIPIFLQPFWLDAVSEKWDVAIAEREGKIIGVLPYCLKGTIVTKRIYLPPLSFYQSFILDNNLSKAETNKVIIELLKQLPSTIKSYFKLLPQYASISSEKTGYTKEEYKTFVLAPAETDYSKLSKNHKRNIDKGTKGNYIIKISKDINRSYLLLISTFKKQNQKVPIEFNDFRKLVNILIKNQAGNVINCLSVEGNLLASALIVKDKTSIYYLLGGYDDAYRNTGAMTYLLWNCIQQAKTENLEFNFCGSSKKSIAAYFSGFGASQQTLSIWKKGISV